ncbi:MAG TPA: nitrilase-related carbon-nitrogen hydrolase [Gaiellaceae bacterium]|nr:nitrilase-related carbon-nitrogen hydrolase [Gaiellaceae bacterium]
MQALLCQLTSAIGDPAGNARRAAEAILDHPEVDLAVFPELYLGGYSYHGLRRSARTVDDEELRLVRRACAEAGTAAVVGFAERTAGGVANSAAIVDRDGSVAAVYRKTQLFGGERSAFVPGEELLVLPLLGRRVTPLICFDIEFPEPARAAALAGADLLVTSSANMRPFFVDHEVASKARAVENRVAHLYANAVGPGDDFVFVGGSRAVSPLGDVVAEASRDREELLVVEVPEPGGVDERVDYLKALQPVPPVRVLDVVGSRGGSDE